MPNPPKNDTPDKALVETATKAILRMDTIRELPGYTAEGIAGSDFTEWEAEQVARTVIAALSQPQHGGLVEAVRKAAKNASPDRGEVRLHASDWMRVMDALNSPVVGEDACTCQRHPTHCANDCPQHGLSEPTYTAGERVDVPPTPTDTADRREAIARVVADYQQRNGIADEDAWNDGWGLADALIAASLIAVPDGMVLVDREKLEWIARGETQVFDEDLECLVTVSADAEELSAVASAMIAAATGEAS